LKEAPSHRTIAVRTTLQSIASVITQYDRPELIGRHLIDLLAKSGATTCAAATISVSGKTNILASTGQLPETGFDQLQSRLLIGRMQDRVVEIWMQPKA